MKTKAFLIFLTFLLCSTLSPLISIAQDYTTWSLPEGATKRLGKGSISEIAYSPDGTQLAVASGIGIWIYDAHTGKELNLFTGHTSHVESVSFSPDGETLAGSGIGLYDVSIWDVSTGDLLHILTGHTGTVGSLSFSPDGETLATGSWDGTVLLWELTPASTPEPERLAEDINNDGTVNIQDLVAVAAALGQIGKNDADVNGDGAVNIQDLVGVAAALGEVAAAPAALRQQGATLLTQEEVQHWLTQAQHAKLTDPHSQAGIHFLQYLLAALIPKETALFANYPNPFNPETWIPYQLAKPAAVTLTIYAVDGKLVRTLGLGHQPVGIYESKSRAAYWNGKNEIGESVASGVYFYTLTAGDFTATRKMLILK